MSRNAAQDVMMFFTFNLSSIRGFRWIILVPVLVYIILILLKIKDTERFRSTDASSRHQEQLGLERLIFELEGATPSATLRKDLAHFKYIQVGNDNKQVPKVPIETREDSRNLLEDIFLRADVDGNDVLDIQELSRWIHAKVTDHIGRAVRENYGLFTVVDVDPSDGQITWEEYHAYFLRKHGFSEHYISSHNKKHVELARNLKETIMRDRARWSEAAKNDPEKLTLDEFLAFTHPESSDRALLQMVEEMFDKFDRDGDELLTEEEFASLPTEGMGLEFREEKTESTKGTEDRRKEFRYLIDKNKDGKADRSELLMYIDPRNPRHAIQEAQHLIELSDINNDGKLNLPEILSKMDLFLDSKMVDTEKSFHDEFR